MTVRNSIKILTVTIVVTLALNSCRQNRIHYHEPIIESELKRISQFDTINTTILPFNNQFGYPFDSSYNQAILTENDIICMDSLLIEYITEYNNSLPEAYKQFSINLSTRNYKKQLIVATNSKREKEVWLNFFCETWERNWKKEIMMVKDGGNCYFNFKINLTKKKFYNLMVNGVA